ncbi:hypothetical protein SpCBS45565_g01904 [Spizellomyces sp. 'palustris']|nr:hypothetical protein SpCBS45565_g01904 [Spizellomyces sp. 'palustris']
MATFVLLDEAARQVSNLPLMSQKEKRKMPANWRANACRCIKETTEARLVKAGFTDIFEEAKRDLINHIGQASAGPGAKRRPLTNEQKEQRRARVAIDRALGHQGFFMRGAPGSDERIAQAEQLWLKRRPEFGQLIPYEQKKEWLDWVVSSPAGVSLITSVISAITTGAIKDPQKIVIRSLGLHAEHFDDPNVQQQLLERLETMRKGRAQSSAFLQAQRARALQRWGRDVQSALHTEPAPLHGQTVTCHQRTISFYANVARASVRLSFNVRPGIRAQHPRLSFKADGIHLVDEDGNQLGLAIALTDMPYLEIHGANLQAVWLHESSLMVGRMRMICRSQPRKPAAKVCPTKESVPIEAYKPARWHLVVSQVAGRGGSRGPQRDKIPLGRCNAALPQPPSMDPEPFSFASGEDL